MIKFRRASGSQGRLLAGRRAQVLAAGMALLLTSGFTAQANAATKPAHNHFIAYTPEAPAPASYVAKAQLFDANGKLVYTWKKESKGNKSIKWGFYSVDSKAYVEVSILTRSSTGKQDVKFGPKSSVCDHDVIFSTTKIKYNIVDCK